MGVESGEGALPTPLNTWYMVRATAGDGGVFLQRDHTTLRDVVLL